jgi:HAD superfamily hydrolase (TIGR01509 family)
MGPDLKIVSEMMGFPKETMSESIKSAVEEFTHEVMRGDSFFPRTRETLDELVAQHKLAIYSNGVSSIVNGLIEKHGLEDYFDVVITSETSVKPSREGIDIILNQVGERNGFMIDDAAEGIHAAKSAGITSIGALYGLNPQKLLLSRPHAVIEDVSEVPAVVARL